MGTCSNRFSLSPFRNGALERAVSDTNDAVNKVAEKMISATKGYVERALAPILNRLAAVESTKTSLDQLGPRVSTVELRCGALALLLGRSNPEGIKDLEKL